MSGIPVLPDENATKLAVELGKLIGYNIEESHISTAHRLPNTKLAVELGKLIGYNIEESHISTAHRLPNTSKTNSLTRNAPICTLRLASG